MQAVAKRLVSEPKNYRYQEKDIDIWQRCGGDRQLMHGCHFQEIELDSMQYFWQDLGMGLGNLKIYAMPASATVDYYREETITVTIPEIYVYVRKLYTHRGEDRYLGHFNKEGIIFVDENTPKIHETVKNTQGSDQIKSQAPKGIGSHVTSEQKQSQNSTYWEVNSSDLKAWQDAYKQGGDFLIFSDFKKIKLKDAILVEVTSLEKSGVAWCDRWRQRNDIEALKEPFQGNVRRFLEALTAGGVRYVINTTWRPPQRSYLMYYAAEIHNGKLSPNKVPPFVPQNDDEPVNIYWEHINAKGVSDKDAAQKSATAMYKKFDATVAIGKPYASNHNGAEAVDISFTPVWGIGHIVMDASGNAVSIASQKDIMKVGATYLVYHWNYHGRVRNKIDPAHWSKTGN